MKLLEKFSGIKVLVIGDIMLDRYFWGTVRRISPEAPVPVVSLNKTTLVAGGAANVAANVAGLNAIPYLVGLTGNDYEADLLETVLKKAKINTEFLIKLDSRNTTVKTRIIAHQQQIVRLDQESVEPVTNEEEEIIFDKIEKILNRIDIIILSDYAKGFLTEELLERLIMKAKAKNKLIIVDPKGKDFDKYKGATIITPNHGEAAESCKLEIESKNMVEKAGSVLMKNLQTSGILITQGENGMTLFQKGKKTVKIKSLARKVFDVTGAGDTVIACLAVGIAAGLDFISAAKIANCAAGAVIEYFGTTSINTELLKAALKESNLEHN